MNAIATATARVAVIGALALLTFFGFPGHTWLQQDTQIYAAILEHLRDPAVLRNDILVQQPHVAFTLYDESAIALRAISGLGFREVLAVTQVVTRALGIWGLLLMAEAIGLGFAPALLVAGICSLGVVIAGPSVLTVEYEPTPRAFAVPLLICGVGLAARRRYWGAGIAGAVAFLYHPPTAVPFWGVYCALLLWPSKAGVRRARFIGLVPLLAAVPILLLAARSQAAAGEAQAFFGSIAPAQESLQRLRTSYVWISMWPASTIIHHLVLFGVLLAAWARVRRHMGLELRVFLLGLPILGVLSMPLSWLLLERWGWVLVPQIQPMRCLLFVALGMQFLTAAAGCHAALARRNFEAFAWFALAYLLPLQPLVTATPVWGRMALVAGLAALSVLAMAARWRAFRFAPAAAVAAFLAIPSVGGVAPYPRLHTPALAKLSAWAQANTSQDAVFIFPDAARALYPGVFRSEALRAVYVDWKGGGQVNYLKELGDEWWLRWQLTLGAGYRGADHLKDTLPKYAALGCRYAVLQTRNRLPRQPVFENADYVVYDLR